MRGVRIINYNLDKNIENLRKAIKDLPERLMDTVLWAVENYEYVEEICGNCEMTEEQVTKRKEKAIADKDYTIFVLLCIVQILRESKSNSQP